MRKPELPALIGVLFYAARLVFLSHAPLIPGMDSLAGQHLVFNAGVVGVSFFFVLSGFILTYNYVDVFRSTLPVAGYKKFLWDRFTKIYPVHLAITLLMIPMQVFSPNFPLDWRALPRSFSSPCMRVFLDGFSMAAPNPHNSSMFLGLLLRALRSSYAEWSWHTCTSLLRQDIGLLRRPSFRSSGRHSFFSVRSTENMRRGLSGADCCMRRGPHS